MLEEDSRVAVVLAEISDARLRAIAQPYADRIFNVGIREQLMIGVAAGLAMSGMIPIAHSYASFLVDRTYEQIKLDLTHQNVPAVLVSIGGSYDASHEGRTHQSPGDVALFDTIGGWRVDVPGHPDEVEPLLRRAVAAGGRTYIRLSARSNAHPTALQEHWQIIGQGTRATVVAVGPLLDLVVEATRSLDVTVLHAITVRPFDHGTLTATLRSPSIVIVEPYLAGTSSVFLERALMNAPHRCLSLGVGSQELRSYGTGLDHERVHGIDAEGIRRSIMQFLSLA